MSVKIKKNIAGILSFIFIFILSMPLFLEVRTAYGATSITENYRLGFTNNDRGQEIASGTAYSSISFWHYPDNGGEWKLFREDLTEWQTISDPTGQKLNAMPQLSGIQFTYNLPQEARNVINTKGIDKLGVFIDEGQDYTVYNPNISYTLTNFEL